LGPIKEYVDPKGRIPDISSPTRPVRCYLMKRN
jgi:hypothetical protein